MTRRQESVDKQIGDRRVPSLPPPFREVPFDWRRSEGVAFVLPVGILGGVTVSTLVLGAIGAWAGHEQVATYAGNLVPWELGAVVITALLIDRPRSVAKLTEAILKWVWPKRKSG